MNARKELFAAKKEAISELMTNALRKDEVKTEDYASLSVVNGGGERKSFSESDLQLAVYHSLICSVILIRSLCAHSFCRDLPMPRQLCPVL